MTYFKMEDDEVKTSKIFFSLIGIALLIVSLGILLLFITGKPAEEAIKIGEIQTYSKLTSFTFPYRNGWQLALDEINTTGGVLGK